MSWNPDYDKIIKIIRAHKGKRNAITVPEIAQILGAEEYWQSKPATRRLIRELIDDHKAPIGSCQRGYYLITNEAEFQENKKDLTARANAIDTRLRNLERAWRIEQKQVKGQLSLW